MPAGELVGDRNCSSEAQSVIHPQRIQTLVIVGGGTAGWMTAASLQHHFRNTGLHITLVESSAIGTIGVGEATTPTIRRFYQNLGLRDLDVMRATHATCKLGIQFNDWLRPGSSFIHPFGLFGQDLRGVGFHHYWLKLRQLGQASALGDYSLGATLAQQGKFTLPSPNPPSMLSVFDWALHFDAGLFAGYLRDFALRLGTRRIDAGITGVKLREPDGFIESLALDNGTSIGADLFIDCSGFRGLLIEEALHSGYENWSHWLLCDTAFAVQSEAVTEPAPYTRVTAQPAGWQWQIPLQNRSGNGHVFSSRFMSDEQAERLLREQVPGRLLRAPRKLTFTPGRRRRAWVKNCIAVGLAAGFLEPLESTSIALIETAIEKIKLLFPDQAFNQACIDEFNEMTALEYERVRDFIVLHYTLNARNDSEFWRYCSAMAVPETLEKKMALFKARGHFVKYRWEMFQPASWLAIYSGFDYLPEIYDPMVDSLPVNALQNSLEEMKASLGRAAADAPGHGEFIAQYCSIADRGSSQGA